MGADADVDVCGSGERGRGRVVNVERVCARVSGQAVEVMFRQVERKGENSRQFSSELETLDPEGDCGFAQAFEMGGVGPDQVVAHDRFLLRGG